MDMLFLTLADASGADDFLRRLAARADPGENGASTEAAVASILAQVKNSGLEAVLDYTRRYDAPAFTAEQFAVPQQKLAEAAAVIPHEDMGVIRLAIANIRAFHEAQKEESWLRTLPDGAILGQIVRPVDRAGLYVPGGKGGATPLVSSLLMNAIPAQTAGVGELAVISPPMADGSLNKHILAAAHLLGITEVYAAGSAWAVAALAYGAGPLRPVDVIAGPGNIYVATAKRLLIGSVGIDMIAGPSEICIIADAGADPAFIAADMLSQAEHDAQASSVCLCVDEAVACGTLAELEKQCATLPRAEVARAALAAHGAVLRVPDLATAVAIANRIAPEHLELLVDDPWCLLPVIRHAGAVFMGHFAAEALGDYYAGPNHVLPTMGTARFSSALSVRTFCKKSSIIAASRSFAVGSALAVARLARLEGLEAHARSALIRADSNRKG
jgi:histidinol dehydrogenase